MEETKLLILKGKIYKHNVMSIEFKCKYCDQKIVYANSFGNLL